jgi:hypothetical protein
MKKNCWEVKSCGREPGGKNTDRLGICPAAVEVHLDGVHGGKNAGRACWVVAGTLCAGEIQGTFTTKFGSCEKCDFYHLVQKEEFPRFVLCSGLLARLRPGKGGGKP